MAAGKWKLYDYAKLNIGNGLIDLDTHAFKIILLSSASNANTLSVGTGLLADLTNQLSTANGYTQNSKVLTGTWTRSSGTITFDGDNPVWTASGGPIAARFAVIYDDTAAGDPLLCVCLLDTTPADVTATDGNTLTITMNASGIFTLSGADSD